MRIRKPITEDMCITLNRPLDKSKFYRMKKRLNHNHPLKRAYITDFGITLVCDSVDDRLKVEAYLMEKIYEVIEWQ